ncbi:MAG: tRNA-specific 2-thiouridylase MnmA [Candidatus Pacebacteria bacterium GW2011_GWB1_47_8]|nr:MAG: tRNA-specific 2-thiouridylase MnmA [Candidatus Pacebacteria bacterium GW2011_GWA1_46_10]KKU84579.1 MAG: tRNA-specific 2-thiouridylase MnmA [Candidatus Pacebacteria bacterium GW2011_GWB1_47_8]
MKRIVLGLSGGVDSAVSAVLLKKQGYQVDAVYLECWHEPGCRAEGDRQDALQVALQLDLPFQVLNFKKPYREKVMQYFLDEYQAGRTPNPDVMCNKIIKFGLFYDWAMKQGYDAIATGHYAKADGQFLYVPKDKIKDQTYFLYQIRQEQLAHVVFPLAELTKQAVRQLAHQAKLPVADKKDSVGICFVGDINVPKFLAENLGTKPGKIVDEHGNILGQHRGLWFHTVGQRHGFNYDKKKYAQLNPILHKDELPAMYVIDKNIKANELVIGPKQATRVKTLHVSNLHLLGLTQAELFKRTDLRVRIRHTGQLTDCEIKKMGNRYSVKLKQLVEGVASGQSAVFYTYEKAGRCLGGATIN